MSFIEIEEFKNEEFRWYFTKLWNLINKLKLLILTSSFAYRMKAYQQVSFFDSFSCKVVLDTVVYTVQKKEHWLVSVCVYVLVRVCMCLCACVHGRVYKCVYNPLTAVIDGQTR